jgi:hypothetical protein
MAISTKVVTRLGILTRAASRAIARMKRELLLKVGILNQHEHESAFSTTIEHLRKYIQWYMRKMGCEIWEEWVIAQCELTAPRKCTR